MAKNEPLNRTFFCKHCHVGVLEPHVTLVNYKKCPICGFCQEVPSTKHVVDRITGNDTTKK